MSTPTRPCPPCSGTGKNYDPWPIVRTCRTCKGSGRLLGSDPYTWPVAAPADQPERS